MDDEPGSDRSDGPKGSTIYGRSLEDGGSRRVLIRDGRVAAITSQDVATDLPYVSSGWVDLQINGCDGHDANATGADPAVIAAMVRSMWRSGVTGSCVTIITESEGHMTRAFEAIADACDSNPLIDASVLGIHVEGPHISREDGPRGVHSLAHVRPPDVEEFRRWQLAARGRIKMVTLSPEYDQAVGYIRALVAEGVVASIGHTMATGPQIRAAVDAGATASTHLGNGSHAVLPRHPNYLWDQLNEDRLFAGFIFDGHLLPPSVMKPLLRAKGVNRSFLVSDAVALAGLAPGTYESFSGATVELTPAGRLEVVGTPYLAGAVEMLPIGIANAVRYGEASLTEAIQMVTTNPSRLLGLSPLEGHDSLRVGAKANLTMFDHVEGSGAIEVVRTIVAGQIVYAATDTQ